MVDSLRQNYTETSTGIALAEGLESVNSALEGQYKSASAQGLTAAIAGASALSKTLKNMKVSRQDFWKVLQLAGLAQNPFLTVLYNSPMYKRHSFHWTLIPENPDDSNILKHITNKFRFHEMPGINNSAPGGLLLNYPDMVKPLIVPTGFFYDFKFCMIDPSRCELCTRRHTGIIHKDLVPTGIRIILHLLEIEYWTKGDVNDAIHNPNLAT